MTVFPSFIKKVPKKNHTPLNVKKLEKKQEEVPETQVAVINRSIVGVRMPFAVDKYVFITIGSALFFVAGLGFWVYVTYFFTQ